MKRENFIEVNNDEYIKCRNIIMEVRDTIYEIKETIIDDRIDELKQKEKRFDYHYYRFNGSEDCEDDCKGWDDDYKRCDCHNKHVYWYYDEEKDCITANSK